MKPCRKCGEKTSFQVCPLCSRTAQMTRQNRCNMRRDIKRKAERIERMAAAKVARRLLVLKAGRG